MTTHIKHPYTDQTFAPGAPYKLATNKLSMGAGSKKKIVHRKKKPEQAGGLPIIPLIAAAYATLKSVQPGTKVAKALEENVSEEGKKKLPYKISHKIASVMRSMGIGNKSSIRHKRK